LINISVFAIGVGAFTILSICNTFDYGQGWRNGGPT